MLLEDAKWKAHWLMSDLCTRLNATVYDKKEAMNACYATTPEGHTFGVCIFGVHKKYEKTLRPQVILVFPCDEAFIKDRPINIKFKELMDELASEKDAFFRTQDDMVVQMIAVDEENYNEIVDGFIIVMNEIAMYPQNGAVHK